jgi:hypothetical protein
LGLVALDYLLLGVPAAEPSCDLAVWLVDAPSPPALEPDWVAALVSCGVADGAAPLEPVPDAGACVESACETCDGGLLD